MIENYHPSERITTHEYVLEFWKGEKRELWFDCDKNGKVLPMKREERKLYNNAIKHKSEYCMQIHVYEHTYTEPAYGTCTCGETVYLTGNVNGATACPNCGKWYNIFGTELVSIKDWRR